MEFQLQLCSVVKDIPFLNSVFSSEDMIFPPLKSSDSSKEVLLKDDSDLQMFLLVYIYYENIFLCNIYKF